MTRAPLDRDASGRRALAVAIVSVAGLQLAACASVAPRPIELASTPAAVELTPAPVPEVGRAPLAKRPLHPSAHKVGAPYKAHGMWFVPAEQPNYDEVGLASWYGDAFNGRPTATGEIFNMDGRSAAHATLPLPCIVEVTNLDNGRSMRIRLNDRGPFHPGRIIDLSKGAAKELGFYQQGTARVRVRYIGPALGAEDKLIYAYNPFTRTVRATPPAPTLAEYAAGDPPLSAPAPETPQAIADEGRSGVTRPRSYTGQPAPYQMAYDADLRAFAERITAPAAKAPAAKGFEVQIGAYADRRAAERQASQVAASAPAAVKPKDVQGRRLYRVVVGTFATAEEASRARDDVVALGYAGAEVTGATQ